MTGFNSKRDAAVDKDALFEKFELPQPPQRVWVGLNEKERNDIEDDFYANISIHVFDAIEAKLKEKNT